MSAIRYLNELETERKEIESMIHSLDNASAEELAVWWERLANWWRQRDLGFGDGSGMFRFAQNKAERYREASMNRCEFCNSPAITSEQFDRAVWVCRECHAA